MIIPMIEGDPQIIFMYGMYSDDGTKRGVMNTLIIIAAVGFKLKMVVAKVLSFGENQFWLTLLTRLMTIKAEKAVIPWPVIAIEYLPMLGINGYNPGNELNIQRAAPKSKKPM